MSTPVDLSKLTYINKLADYTGGALMVECFATWCPPCRAQIPHLAELAKKFPNVYIISVSNEDTTAVTTMKGKMPKMSEYNLAVDPSGEVSKLMEQHSVAGIPHCFIFDKAGALVTHCHPAEADQHLAKM